MISPKLKIYSRAVIASRIALGEDVTIDLVTIVSDETIINDNVSIKYYTLIGFEAKLRIKWGRFVAEYIKSISPE